MDPSLKDITQDTPPESNLNYFGRPKKRSGINANKIPYDIILSSNEILNNLGTELKDDYETSELIEAWRCHIDPNMRLHTLDEQVN